MFTTFSNHLDGAVKNMLKICSEQTQKYQSHFKREYQTVGKAFMQLGAALGQDGNTRKKLQNVCCIFLFFFYQYTFSASLDMINLNNAITVTGEAYEDIGKMFDDQPKNDWERLGDTMHDYRGLLAGWPNVLQIHQVYKEEEKMNDQNCS